MSGNLHWTETERGNIRLHYKILGSTTLKVSRHINGRTMMRIFIEKILSGRIRISATSHS